MIRKKISESNNASYHDMPLEPQIMYMSNSNETFWESPEINNFLGTHG